MKILVVGDSYLPVSVFRTAFAELSLNHRIAYLQIDAGASPIPGIRSENAIREYEGTPDELRAALTNEDVLVVHGAPVTEEVLAASPNLALVCCARGGPVNVDVGAAARRGIPVVTAPGKNADAVADLTIAFMIMLTRGIQKAERFLHSGGQMSSTFEGAQFFGHDLSGRILGLVGFGHVGRRVAARARAFEMPVLVYDPFVPSEEIRSPGIEHCGFDALLAGSDIVSLHARATAENANLFDAAAFGKMRDASVFINTARETLVDEKALADALRSGRLAGAALDVLRPAPRSSQTPLLDLENVILTPHIGGATHETLLRGAEMMAAEVSRFIERRPLLHVVKLEGRAASNAAQV
jgi:D-3-phosphoglycerate dehydrogenase